MSIVGKIWYNLCIKPKKKRSYTMYRCANRNQMDLFPKAIENYVKEDDPVRAYDAFAEALDLNELGIALDENKTGNPEYHPRTMLKLLVYGYSYGFRSSRKLERATHHNVSFMWLMGGLTPDHKTIAEFRRRYIHALKNVLKQCARMCITLELIEGNTLFTDGSKIRANASIKNTWTKKKCVESLKQIDKRIDAILSECDNTDDYEKDQKPLVNLTEELKDKEILKNRVQNVLKELKQDHKKSINTIDPECTRVNSPHGSHAGYNAQATVDEKHGLIVNTDVVSENNDVNQFAEQIDQANETLEKKCDTACADSGYANTKELEKIDKQDIKVIVPSQRQASKKEPKPFDKENFRYDHERDCYICPQGNILTYRGTDKHKPRKKYLIEKSHLCKQCRRFKTCTKSKYGRQVSRLINEETRQKLEAQYKQTKSQAIYRLRQQKVELPFGHIKRNLKVDAFLIRGRDGAKAEMSLLASCFNLSRMITILGVQGLIQAIKG